MVGDGDFVIVLKWFLGEGTPWSSQFLRNVLFFIHFQCESVKLAAKPMVWYIHYTTE